MPRRNRTRGRRPQNRRNRWTDAPPDEIAMTARGNRALLLPMVSATGACPTGKIRYGNKDDAEEALRRAIINRAILHSIVSEERYYPMPGDRPCECGGYHLTSSPRRKR